jgi:hypothetical protein
VTPRIATHRGRSFLLLLGALAVGGNLLASCDRDHRFELTLRNRSFDGVALVNAACIRATNGCTTILGESSWVAADGRTAIGRAQTIVFRADQTADQSDSRLESGNSVYFGPVDCGGQQWKLIYYREPDPRTGPKGSFELDIDDGNRLTIEPQNVVSVDNGRDTFCFEEAGTWRGTAGKVRNDRGTFDLHYDSVQVVLRLVEN